MDLAVAGQHGDGNFENNAVYIEAGQRIGRVIVVIVEIENVLIEDAAAYRLPKVQRIERGPQIDKERIRHRSREHLDIVPQLIDTLRAQLAS